MLRSLTLCLLLLISACSTAQPERSAINAINDTLDAFHKAAAEADEETYFSLLSDDAVFLGTDASERWTKGEFQRWAEPYFARESAWTYEPRRRSISINAMGSTAWFDETVHNDKYGDLRGTGVLIHTPDGWKIAQYNLTFPIPNEIAGQVVEMIRSVEESR